MQQIDTDNNSWISIQELKEYILGKETVENFIDKKCDINRDDI